MIGLLTTLLILAAIISTLWDLRVLQRLWAWLKI